MAQPSVCCRYIYLKPCSHFILIFLGLRPGLFFEMFLFTLRVLFFLGLRPGLFRPSGVLPPAGNFLLAQKVPQKRLPPVALRGFSPHSQPSWGFPPPRPSARVAGRCAKCEGCQQCRLKPTRKICLARNPPGATRNSLEKHPSLATLLGLSSSTPISEGRGATCKIWGVSAVLSAFNLVSSTRGFQTPICQLYITSCQFTN